MDLNKIENFAKPFEPSVDKLPDEEKFKARTDFMTLIDDVLLANMSQVTVSEHRALTTDTNEQGEDIYETKREASYLTRTEERTLDDRYVSELEIYVIDGEDGRRIQIREMDKQGLQRTSIYRTSPDMLEVIRNDTNDKKLSTSRDAAPAHVDRGEALVELRNELENWEREVAMGLNDQPVDSEEVARLRRLLLPDIDDEVDAVR